MKNSLKYKCYPKWMAYVVIALGFAYIYSRKALRWVRGCWIVQAFMCKETWKKTLKNPSIHIIFLVLLGMFIYELLD
jgi:hypothetical protein